MVTYIWKRTVVAFFIPCLLGCEGEPSAAEALLQEYVPEAHLGMRVGELRDVRPDVRFVPYSGYKLKLTSAADSMSAAEFFVSEVDIDDPGRQAKLSGIRISSVEDMVGDSVHARASSWLGDPEFHGCSGLAGIGYDETFVWVVEDHVVILKIPVSRQPRMFSVTSLFFLQGQDWRDWVDNFDSGECQHSGASKPRLSD